MSNLTNFASPANVPFDAARAEAARILSLQKRAFLTDMNPIRAIRLDRLNRVEKMLDRHGHAFAEAIASDFGSRPEIVTVMAEITPVVAAIRRTRKNLARWSKPRRVGVDMAWMPGRAKIIPQPLGVVGIISPWNYPLQLALAPLVAALAAGNRALIKPSELTPRLSALLKTAVAEFFAEDEVAVINGGPDVASAFSELPFDHLLFTGSTAIGRLVAQAAAKNLTPVTLELGGKSPTIIDVSANLTTSADRITFAKFLNAGQTCIAPDYALVPRSLQSKFVDAMKAAILKQYPSIKGNPDVNGIISDRYADRLRKLVEDARAKGANVIPVGGDGITDRRIVTPTLIVGATPEMTIMQEEIFGPLLPIVTADTLDEALAFINERDRPLALYWFGNDSAKQKKVLAQTISGGVTINDAMVHFLQEGLPFGGVGASGIGHYHGEYGFKTFSKEKPVFFQSRFSGASMVYPPFTGFSRRFVNFLKRMA
jgi:coniferyl-aldehyde dehydrogenase